MSFVEVGFIFIFFVEKTSPLFISFSEGVYPYFYLFDLTKCFLGACKWSYSAHFITFYDLIFLYWVFYLDYSVVSYIWFIYVKLTVFLCASSLLSFGLGSLELRNFNTLGHFIDSIILILPPFISWFSFYILLNIEFSNNSAADGLISSSTVRHICRNFFILSEYFEEISLYSPFVIFL